MVEVDTLRTSETTAKTKQASYDAGECQHDSVLSVCKIVFIAQEEGRCSGVFLYLRKADPLSHPRSLFLYLWAEDNHTRSLNAGGIISGVALSAAPAIYRGLSRRQLCQAALSSEVGDRHYARSMYAVPGRLTLCQVNVRYARSRRGPEVPRCLGGADMA
ncbi:hypothetical protein B296_00023604 [Ensete ventricosum]|uniref:Uncharacterized protein n=1 Tax=Ensete ventricosum TaxID=4639 RepID=A0A427ANL9_ENSVE|nr:hypothetical protein B296_00023604 [Ensete ventricosum]